MDAETRLLIEQFKTARGHRWAVMLKEINARIGDQIREDARQFKSQDGKITIVHIGRLCLRYNIPFKTMCEQFLEGVLPTGTYDLIMDGGWRGKVKDILQAAAMKEEE